MHYVVLIILMFLLQNN